ncbi:hypothetical protein T05_13306 [Trichinella murrelli]|uniref:Uncharacterized protein n=1 Tax=Trichinella murrelli TaxID=144512 RepID=A0A0V0U928_9BILA|nr:hypothetical protein T05_13306 [Trichinella murrelli]
MMLKKKDNCQLKIFIRINFLLPSITSNSSSVCKNILFFEYLSTIGQMNEYRWSGCSVWADNSCLPLSLRSGSTDVR